MRNDRTKNHILIYTLIERITPEFFSQFFVHLTKISHYLPTNVYLMRHGWHSVVIGCQCSLFTISDSSLDLSVRNIANSLNVTSLPYSKDSFDGFSRNAFMMRLPTRSYKKIIVIINYHKAGCTVRINIGIYFFVMAKDCYNAISPPMANKWMTNDNAAEECIILFP